MKLVKFETEILLECAWLRKPRPWGAAVGAALDSLRGKALISPYGWITPKGWAYAVFHLPSKEPTR